MVQINKVLTEDDIKEQLGIPAYKGPCKLNPQCLAWDEGDDGRIWDWYSQSWVECPGCNMHNKYSFKYIQPEPVQWNLQYNGGAFGGNYVVVNNAGAIAAGQVFEDEEEEYLPGPEQF